MLTTMNVLIIRILVVISVFASANVLLAGELRSVQVVRVIANEIPGPSLQAYQDANAEVSLFLSREVGMNVGCFISPNRTGYTIVWVDVDNQELTTALRREAEAIVRKCLEPVDDRGHAPAVEKEAEQTTNSTR